MANYKFDEEKETYYKGRTYTCKASKKYAETKAKAIEIIESGKYDLTENDFWTLKQYMDNGTCLYNGLIISHNGCLKINDKLDNPFLSNCCGEPIDFTITKKVGKETKEVKGIRQVYKESRNLFITKGEYVKQEIYNASGDEIYEVGEISTENLMNDYPFAMLLKRLFDRVVLKKSKLAFMGIMSEAEIDEKQDLRSTFDEDIELKKQLVEKFNQLDVQKKADILNMFRVKSPEDLKIETLKGVVNG